MNNRKKITLVVLGLILFFTPVVFTAAQEEPDDTFIMELSRIMERQNWEASEVGELVRNLKTYRFQRLEGVDPEVVALALQYARRNAGESLETPEMARIAAQVMTMAGEMKALGFDDTEITASALNGVREMVTVRTQNRTGTDAPEDALQVREQVRQQIRDAQCEELKTQTRTRIRTSNPHDADEWAPPGPGGSSGSASSSGPLGPGAGPGVPVSGSTPQGPSSGE